MSKKNAYKLSRREESMLGAAKAVSDMERDWYSKSLKEQNNERFENAKKQIQK